MIDILQVSLFAIRVHRQDRRKYSGVPYYHHLARVAAAVTDVTNGKPEMVAAAWLHDTVEDHPDVVSDILISSLWGEAVCELVIGLSNRSKLAMPGASRAERKKYDCERLRGQTREVKIIKLCDRLDNIRDVDVAKAGDFAAMYAEETENLLENALKGTHAMLEGTLRQAVAELKAAAHDR